MDTWKFFELVPFAILGCLGGALGSLVIAIITKLEKWRRSNSGFGQWSRAHPVLEVGAVACVTALVNFSNIYLRGSSLSLLHKLFSSCSSYHATQAQQMDPDSLDSTVGMALCGADLQGSNTDGAGTEWLNLSLLLLAGLFKLVLCIFTFGLKIPCGIFVPALASGACLGRVFGWLLHLWHKEIGDSLFFSVCAGQTYCVSPHIYAVVASAAMLCGITRMTMSLAVVMFELTGGLDLIIPLMLAIVCAKFTGDLVCGMVGWGDQGKSGIFGKMIHLNG